MSYTVAIKDDEIGYSNQNGKRSYSVKYIVESTTLNDLDIYSAQNATGMPSLGDAYTYDAGVFVANITLDERKDASGSKTVFIFTVDYQTSSSDLTLNQNSADPLSEPPKVSTATVRYQVPFEKAYKDGDSNGEPTEDVLNTAAQPFDPPATREIVHPVITIQYNSRSYNHSWIDDFVGTTNKSSITFVGKTANPNCARINDISASNNFDVNGDEYWTISVSIETSKEPFKRKLLSQGMMALNEAGSIDNIYVETDPDTSASIIKCKSDITGLVQKMKDGKAEPVSEPKLLDENGKILAQDGTPYYIEKQGNFKASWNALNIPRTSKTNSNR